MKNLRLLLGLAIVFLVAVTARTNANVFASNVRITQQGTLGPFDGKFNDGTGVSIRFVLSDHADSVVVSIKSGSTLVRTLKGTNYSVGDSSIVWDGKNSGGSYVSSGTYSFSIATYDKGYAAYTEIVYYGAPGLSTRGMTTVNNPAIKSFGFIFGVDNNGFQGNIGIDRFSGDGQPWGDAKGATAFFNSGVTLGPGEARWGTQADADGYIYLLGRTAKQVYRFHPDTANVVVVDTGYGPYYPFAIAVRNDGATKTVAVVANVNSTTATLSGDSRILTYKLNSSAVTYFGPKDTLVKGLGSYAYWDVIFGRDSSFYAAFISSSGDWPRSGVAKFDLRGKKLPLTMADTVWTARVDSGRVGTLTMYFGTPTDGSKDAIYFVNARIGSGNPPFGQGIYALTGLNATRPTRGLAYADRDNNASITKSDVSVDAAGNVVYFENSNEEVAVISPPAGANSYTTTVSFIINVLSGVEQTDLVPTAFTLEQNYPNPFNPTTTIRFSLPNAASVTLRVYDLLGREVGELVNQEMKQGIYNFRFDAGRLAAGTYLYRLTAISKKEGKQQVFTETKKLVVLK